MTRAEYMEELTQALKAYDEDFALDIIGDMAKIWGGNWLRVLEANRKL